MSLQVTGKNIRVGESFQTYVSDKIDDAVEKYIGEYLTAHVRVEKERGRFFTSCSVRVKTGLLLECTGEGTDAYASADAAFEHLEKRLRRYKRRLKNRHHDVTTDRQEDVAGVEINDFVVELTESVQHENGLVQPISVDDSPLIVAETARTLHRLSVSEAVMRLDLTEEPFLVFRNAGSGEVNVVYRRSDGNIGWIDPTSPASAGAADDAPVVDVAVHKVAAVKGASGGVQAPRGVSGRSGAKQPSAARSKRSA